MLKHIKALFAAIKDNYLLLAALLLVVLLLYPFYTFYIPNFDGAYNLQIPKNILTAHRYQTNIAPFDVRITTGYPVLLPITLAFFAFGFSLAGVKLVMFSFFLSIIIGLYLLAKNFFKRADASLIAIAFFVCLYFCKVPHAILFLYEAIGELPSFSFLLFSLLSISNHYRENARDRRRLFLGGVLCGLAIETKLIMVLALPSLCLFFAFKANRNNYREFGRDVAVFFLSMSVPIILFALFQISQLGIDGFLANKNALLLYMKQNAASGIEAGYLNSTHIQEKDLSGIQAGVVKLYNFIYEHLRVARADLKIPVVNWIVIILLQAYLFYFFFKRKYHAGCCMIFFFITYALWWFSLNGSFWVRHFMPGLVMMLLLYGFCAGVITEKIRQRKRTILTWVLAAACFFSLNITNFEIARANLDVNARRKKCTAYMEAVSFFKENLSSSNIYYRGWWQVPEISLIADKPFKDLNREGVDKNSLNNYLILSKTQKLLNPKGYDADSSLCTDEIVLKNDFYMICKISADSSSK